MPLRTHRGITGSRNMDARPPPEVLSAGPPIPVVDMFLWAVLSWFAYMCFLILPGRLRPRFNVMSTQLVGFNDLAFAAVYMHFAVWVMMAYDLAVRLLCLVLLSSRTLSSLEMIAVAAGPTFMTPDGGVGFQNVGALVDDAVSVAQRAVGFLRMLVGAVPLPPHGISRHELDSWVALEMNAMDTLFSYHGVVVLAAIGFSAAIVGLAFKRHTRAYLRNQLFEQSPESALPAGCKLPRQYRAKPRMFPAWMWVLLWCVWYAAAFAWVEGLPILSGTVVPAVIVFLVIYDILVP